MSPKVLKRVRSLTAHKRSTNLRIAWLDHLVAFPNMAVRYQSGVNRPVRIHCYALLSEYLSMKNLPIETVPISVAFDSSQMAKEVLSQGDTNALIL